MTCPFHQKGKYGRKSSFKMKIKTFSFRPLSPGSLVMLSKSLKNCLTRIKELVEYFWFTQHYSHQRYDFCSSTGHLSVWSLKSSKEQTWTMNFHMFKLVLEKAEEPEIKLATSTGSLKKQESSRKTSISALLTMSKPSTVWITINCGKFLKRWEYQTTWPASWETCIQIRKQQLELDMEQQTGSK